MRSVPVSPVAVWGSALLIALATAGCGGDDGTGPDRSMLVTLSVCALPESGPKVCPAGDVAPLEALEVTVSVDPHGAVLERVIVEVSGLWTQVDTFVPILPTTSPVSGADTALAPPGVGVLTFRARAEGGGRSGSSTPVNVSVSDSEPPSVSAVSLLPTDSVEPGDTVRLAITASDNAVVMSLVVQRSGALSGPDTILVGMPSYSDTVRYEVPPATPYGTPLSFSVVAVDAADLESDPVASASLTIADFTPPSTGGYLNTGIFEPLIPGDTLRGTIDASDNHKLAWVGYRVGEPPLAEDSFPVTTTSVSYEFEALVDASWAGKPDVTLFARDSTGNISTQGYPLTITVLDATRRPYRTAAARGAVSDMAYDAKRDRLYLLHSIDISVVPLATFSHETPIPLPAEVSSASHIDLSTDDDTLLVLMSFFPDTATLGFVDLSQAVPAVDTVHLVYDQALGWTHDIGVAANDKAFITLWNGTGGGGLLEYDLGSGAQALRADIGAVGTIPTPANVLVSGDRLKLSVRWAPVPCCGDDEGQVYDAASNAFGTVRTLGLQNSRDVAASADSDGERYLIGGYLLDGALGSLGYFDFPTSPAGEQVVSALTPDGAYAYFSQLAGDTSLGMIVKVRLADATVMERFVLPELSQHLLVLPDGLTLVAIGTTYVAYAVDLQ